MSVAPQKGTPPFFTKQKRSSICETDSHNLILSRYVFGMLFNSSGGLLHTSYFEATDTLFLFSGDVSSDFQSQSGFCCILIMEANVMYVPSDPPLVLHLLTCIMTSCSHTPCIFLSSLRRRRRRRKSLESTTDTRRTDSQSDTLHFHYPSGALKEHNLGQYGYSHVWELHSVKSVPIDDIIGNNDGVTKTANNNANTMTSSSTSKDANAVYCEHTYTPHRNCDVISSIGGPIVGVGIGGGGGGVGLRREHTYEAAPHTAGIHKIKSRNLSELTSAFSDLDNECKDNTENLNTLDRQNAIST